MCNFELNKDFIDSMQKKTVKEKKGKFGFNKIKAFALEKDSLVSTLQGEVINCMQI